MILPGARTLGSCALALAGIAAAGIPAGCGKSAVEPAAAHEAPPAPQGASSLGPQGASSLGPLGAAPLGPLGAAPLGPPGAASLGPLGAAHATQTAVLAQAPFRARRERPLGAKPEGLCAGDFDGDGFEDLAATLVTPGALRVWRGGPDGLAREPDATPCGDFPLAPQALPPGSFGAAPGAQILAVLSRTARTLDVLGTPARQFALAETPRALAAGRIGERAVLAVACDGRRLEVLRDGADAPETWPLAADLPRCALVSPELDAVLVGFQGETFVEAYKSATGPALGRIALAGIPRALAALDVDGDGDLELAIAGGDRELWIHGCDAAGGARAWFDGRPPRVWTVDAIPLALAVADFDADGRDDLVVLHHYHLSALVLSGLSADGPRRRAQVYAGQTPGGLAVLDVDVDGRPDVVIANRDTQGLGLLLGDGAGALETSASVPLGDFPNALASAGAAPGALRLVALDAKSNTFTAVVRGAGAVRALPGVASGAEARAPSLAELDGRPGLDLAFLATGPHGAELAVASGSEDGTLGPARTQEIGGAASDLLLLDIDLDGAPELALCDPSAATVTLLEASFARGDAAALASAVRANVPSAPRALCAIELDGDPAPEIACVLGAPGARVGIAWLDARRDANGALALAELGFTPLVGAPLDAASADLDGDGRADLAVLVASEPGSSAGAWHALLAAPGGALAFTTGPAVATGGRPHRIAAADLDLDGRAEVFVAAQDSHLVNGWTHTGAPAPGRLALRAFDDLGAGLGPLDLALGDVDGDGLVDLCVANGFSNDLSVLYGRGAAKASSNPAGR